MSNPTDLLSQRGHERETHPVSETKFSLGAWHNTVQHGALLIYESGRGGGAGGHLAGLAGRRGGSLLAGGGARMW